MLGKVFWITGLSGAGKTTIGSELKKSLEKLNIKSVLLDGDIMHSVLDEPKDSFKTDDRLKRAYKYSKICKMLSDQGINVICCCIAMFDEIRDWNRKNIINYFEVFIQVDIDTLIMRDCKGLYNKEKNNMVGFNVETEFPKQPDLIINNTFSDNAHEYSNLILYKSYLNSNSIDYWNMYYSDNQNISIQSDFANFITPYLERSKMIIDLGCGNGRDSFYFSSLGLSVTSIDSSKSAIDIISNSNSDIFAVCDDITKTKAIKAIGFDYFYLRWILHSIPKHKEYELLKNISENSKKGSKIFIECRTTNDALYGVGESIGQYEYISGHYRRFIVSDEIKNEIENLGFKILFFEESDKFSVLANDAPSLLRIIAEK